MANLERARDAEAVATLAVSVLERPRLTPIEAEVILNKDTPKIATWAEVKARREIAIGKLRTLAAIGGERV
jgi:transcription elongation factor